MLAPAIIYNKLSEAFNLFDFPLIECLLQISVCHFFEASFFLPSYPYWVLGFEVNIVFVV